MVEALGVPGCRVTAATELDGGLMLAVGRRRGGGCCPNTVMIYISDFEQKDGMNEAWLAWLPAEHLPTRATIGVAELGKNVLIEVVVSAAKP